MVSPGPRVKRQATLTATGRSARRAIPAIMAADTLSLLPTQDVGERRTCLLDDPIAHDQEDIEAVGENQSAASIARRRLRDFFRALVAAVIPGLFYAIGPLELQVVIFSQTPSGCYNPPHVQLSNFSLLDA